MSSQSAAAKASTESSAASVGVKKDLYEIGEIPQEWNHLVGYNEFNPQAKNVHYTEGGPYFDEYANCEYSSDWFESRDQMLEATQRSMLPVEKKASGQ